MSFKEKVIIFDLETTGLNPFEERITQIAAIKDGGVPENFITYVNPEIEISEFITKLTGISNETVKDAPTEKEALIKLIEFLGDDYVIVAQYAPFDLSFLNYALERNGLEKINPDFFCTRTMSAVLFPNLSHSLGDIINLFDIQLEKAHDAFSDASTTKELFYRLVEIARSHKINFRNKLVEHEDRPLTYKPDNAIILKHIKRKKGAKKNEQRNIKKNKRVIKNIQ